MKIKVINEVGREVNPFPKKRKIWTGIKPNLYKKVPNEAHIKFDESAQSYPAPGIADGEWEAELVWQYQHPVRLDWNNANGQDYSATHKVRQIFALTSTELDIKILKR